MRLDTSMIEVVVSNGLIESYRDDLEGAAESAAGPATIRWTYVPLNEAETRERLVATADVWVSHVLRPAEAVRAHRLSLIAMPGVGTNGLATQHLAREVEIVTAAFHGKAIAQFVLTTMSALARRVIQADAALRRGWWLNPIWNPEATITASLDGATVGLIGFGEIGQEVARLARAFDMNVMAVRSDPSRFADDSPKPDWCGDVCELPVLLEAADYVVVSVPLTEETLGLISAKEIEQMKPGAVLVNVARGGVVDPSPLYEGLRSGQLGGAAIDVWYAYPEHGAEAWPSREPFWELDNVILTPHLSGTSSDVFRARAHHLGSRIGEFARSREAPETRGAVAPRDHPS